MSDQDTAGAYDNVGASKEAIQYHYDVGNDFYSWFLGPTMCYSAALWIEDPAADGSQIDFNSHICYHF